MPCFRIITDAIYIRRDESKVDQFYGGFERVDNNDSRTTTASSSSSTKSKNRRATTTTTAEYSRHQRCWIVGDLCAYYHSGSTIPTPPESLHPRPTTILDPSQLLHNPQQVSIGLILALRHSRTSTGHSSYHAVVRKLVVRCNDRDDDDDGTLGGGTAHPRRTAAGKPNSRKRLSTMSHPVPTTTTGQVLIETMETEVLDLSSNRVLEQIQVQLEQSFCKDDEDKTPTIPRWGLHPSPIEGNGWIWLFRHVYSPRDKNGSLSGQIVQYDWDWQQLAAGADPSIPTPIPLSLQRGWDCLHDRELVQAMTAQWSIWTVPVRQVVQAMSSKRSQPENSAPSQLRKRSKTTAHRSDPPPSSKRTRRGDDAEENDCSTTSKSIDSEAAQASNQQDVVVPSNPLSHSPTVYHLKRKPNNNKRANSLRFYTEFQISTNPIMWAGLTRQSLQKPIVWSISIGDVLLVACAPAEAAAENKPKSCHPFPVPWSVGQVVSLYIPDPSHKDDAAAAQNDDSPSDVPWMMEIRWFYRLHELRSFDEVDIPQHLHRWSLVESDEHVTRVPVHMALGRACFTSIPPQGRSNHRIDSDGVVTVSFVCQDLFLLQYDEKKLRPIADWDDYGSKLSGPLSRGLLCEKAWPGRSDAKRLQKVYQQYIVKKYWLDSHVMDCGFPKEAKHAMAVDPSQNNSVCKPSEGGSNWHDNLQLSEIGLDPGQSQVLGTMNGLELYQSILVQPRHKRFQSNTAARSVSSEQWRLSPGDCVCLATIASHDQPSGNTRRNPWSPFLCPWKVVQILSMYRKLSDPTEKPEVFLEVRLFARISELPTRVRSSLLPRQDDDLVKDNYLLDDEILETDTVEIDVPACRILGLCTVQSAHCFLPANESPAHRAMVQRRVRFLYQSIRQRILPVFSMTPKSWRKAMLHRGLTKSTLLQIESSLARKIASNFDTGSLGSSDALFATLPTDKATPKLLWKRLWRSAPVAPLWTCISEADLLCPCGDRSGLHWVIAIGDVISVRDKGDRGSGTGRFPFTVAWRPCQVLAILSSESSSVPSQAQVRWLSHTFPASGSSDIGVALDGDDSGLADLGLIELTDCLGPITLTTEAMAPISQNETPPFVPLTFMKLEAKGINSDHDLLASIVRRGIRSCPLYSEAEKVDVIRLLGCEVVQAPPLNHQQENERPGTADDKNTFQALSLDPPIVVDSTSGIRFYSRLSLKRVPNKAKDAVSLTQRNLPTTWTVKLGDTVAVHVTQRVGGSKKGKKGDMLPFLVPWQVAEVVTIFQPDDPSKNDDAVQLEVRWFYHCRDLAGRIKGGIPEVEDEVVETDHLDVVSPSKLLAHVALKDETALSASDAEASLRYTCRQFWSCHSKSLVPTGSLDNRINRGRAHSNFFGRYPALHDACRCLGRYKDPTPASESHDSPTAAFQRVIEKLSLTDASKEALHQSSGIIGRETERRFIASFLRAALEGKGDEGKLNATLFVAGPPGVG